MVYGVKRLLIAQILAGMLWLGGCSDSTCTQITVANSEDIPSASLQLAQQIAATLPKDLAQIAQSQVDLVRLEKQQKIQQARAKAEADYEAAKARKEKPKPLPRPTLNINKSLISGLPSIRHEELLAELYGVETPEHRSFFIKDKKLSPAAATLLDVLSKVDDHALDIADYAPDTLRSLAEKVDRMQEILADPARHQFNAHEIRALALALDKGITVNGETIQTASFAAMSDEKRRATAIEILCDFNITPIPRIAANCVRERENVEERTELAEALEFALADAWLTYARQMKYGNLEKFSPEELEKYTTQENPNEVHPKYHQRIVESRLTVATEALFQNPSADAVNLILSDLVPRHEQYAKLQQLREKYREIVANGGWQVVPPDRMFAGGHAPLVKNLKQRLSVEGYYTGDIDDSFDKSLTEAIRKYQRHHQLDETGAVDDVFWRSLNVTADKRLAEIEVNIRRWHKTMFEPCDTYIYINIPSFQVELWRNGVLITRNKTVVGSSTRLCNTRTREWELMNATRLMHAKMTYLVFNPYWNVPPRIEVDEYYKKMQEDPKWLENSDFEYYTPRGGGRVLRQKPGPNNALGKVKLIFPNRYNTYLHDTPKQDIFKYPIRAFSHGCIRVEKAFEFARKVLEVDNQWDDKRVERFFKEKGEHAVDLNTPIDVFIDYHTVTVDDDGQASFLADVYKIIRNEIEPPTALQRRCDPAVDKTSLFRSGGGEDNGP